MDSALAIASLTISGLTAIGSILAYYKCKSCKWFCFECDCFPSENGNVVINNTDNHQETPIIIRQESPMIIRQESPMIIRQESPMIIRQESPMIMRHESPVIIIHTMENQLEWTNRGRSPKPSYDQHQSII